MRPLNAHNTFIRLVQFSILILGAVTLFFLWFLKVCFQPGLGPHVRTRMLSNGRGIHQSILAGYLENPLDEEALGLWPLKDSAQYETNSTAYFTWLMSPEMEVLPVDFHQFWGPGLPRESGNFQSRHNAWSVVSDVSIESDSKTPFLLTRNLNESRLVDWRETSQNRLENLGSRKAGGYVTPFDGDAMVVIYIGGGGQSIIRRDLKWENLNPLSADNEIMEP